jgi:hypothetical protein
MCTICVVQFSLHHVGPLHVCLSVASFIQYLAAICQWSYKLHEPYNKSRTADQIFIKFCMEVMPLEASPSSCFLISYNW